jgi:hypothetical protein
MFVTATSQQYYTNFEDGTLQGWTNKDGTVDMLTVEANGNGFYLQKVCDGTNTAVGEMTIVNTENWVGDFFYSPTGQAGDVDMFTPDEIILRNSNNFDLYIRFGYTGSNGYMVVTTDPILVPAQSDWQVYSSPHFINFPIIHNLTILNDTTGLPFEEIYNNVHDMFADVIEFRIFHNDQIVYDGKLETGTLEVDEIIKYILLATDDQDISKVRLYPNPVKDILSISMPFSEGAILEVYNVLGEKVLIAKLIGDSSSINLSDLESGIYLATIRSKHATTTKKIVKL